MLVSILGPLEVRSAAGAPIPLAGARVRTLAARLAAEAGRPVPVDVLLDTVWDATPPADPANALQTLVSRLRRALGNPGAVVQDAGGYRLRVAEEDVDATRFEALIAEATAAARAGDTDSAGVAAAAALAFVRGPALPELDGAGERYDQLVLTAQEHRLAGEIAAGRFAEAALAAEGLVTAHPLRERFTALLVQALHASGRTAEALAAYERTRRFLGEELGADPSAELRQLQARLLRDGDDDAALPSAAATNLRAARTSFLGRDDELKRLDAQLEAGRLTTVVGPGGAGKTRLAGVVAGRWVDRLADGVWFIELAPVTDSAALPSAILSSLGLRANDLLDRPDRPRVAGTGERLIQSLAESECLLVIDNCEHLIGAVATLVDDLLLRCGAVRVLATSREPLGIDGESVCSLAPLSLPDADADVEAALGHASVQLFTDRAVAARTDFAVDETTVRPVVEIVRRLDGLPLAIELAAARLRVLPLGEVARRLSDRFRLLTGGSRTAMPRHRTLRAVVEWSWDLLSDDERRLAERLAVFPSGATVPAALAVSGATDAAAVSDLLDSLVDKSLLQADGRGELRYRMLETIREYGTERLVARGQIDSVRRAHARFYAALVAEADPWLRRPEQLTWLRRLEDERDNILAALQYLGTSGDASATIELAVRLGFYWTLAGSHTEAASLLAFALSVPGPVDPRRRLAAEGLQALNAMVTGFGDPSVVGPSDEGTAGGTHITPTPPGDDATARLADIGARLDELGLGPDDDQYLIMLRPMMAFFGTDNTSVGELMERSLVLADDWTRATLIMLRANLAENEGDIEQMRADTAQALDLFTGLGERWGLASTLTSSAQLHVLDGDLERAGEEYRLAARYLSDFGASSDLLFLRLRLADLSLRQGDLDGARAETERIRSTRIRGVAFPQRLMADTMSATIARHEGNPAIIREHRERLSAHVAALPVAHPLTGHLQAMTVAAVAGLDLALGDIDAARRRLDVAYPLAVGTRDMPVVAVVGTMVAAWAAAAGQPLVAARMLGAAARLRGAEDSTDVDVRQLTDGLRRELGNRFQAAYAAGRELPRPAALAALDPAGAENESADDQWTEPSARVG